MSDITRRIEKETKVKDLVVLLGERLAPTDLQSLMLEVHRRSVAKLRPSRLLDNYRQNRFTIPSSVDPRTMAEWDRIAYSELPPEFCPVDLSPVSPLGSVSRVTGLSQDWVVSTIRNTEVVADPTNVLALEYASRRRALAEDRPIKLAASHRALRGQKYDNPKAQAHFRLFSLCSGGRDTGDLRIETTMLSEHVGICLRALRRFLGADADLRVSFTEVGSPTHRERLGTGLVDPLRSAFPGVTFLWDEERRSGRSYYRQICFHIHALHPDGRFRELVDGGDVDWAQKLLNNGKERLVISGIGTERLCADFGETQSHGGKGSQ